MHIPYMDFQPVQAQYPSMDPQSVKNIVDPDQLTSAESKGGEWEGAMTDLQKKQKPQDTHRKKAPHYNSVIMISTLYRSTLYLHSSVCG